MNSSTDSNGLGTNSTTSLHEIGGIAYLLIYASEVIPYTVINLLAVLVGVLGKYLFIILQRHSTSTLQSN
jgi:hypothetical protein